MKQLEEDAQPELKVLLVNPRKTGKSRESVVGLVSGENADADLMHYFDVAPGFHRRWGWSAAGVAVCIPGRDRVEKARSATGDTVHTYALKP